VLDSTVDVPCPFTTSEYLGGTVGEIQLIGEFPATKKEPSGCLVRATSTRPLGATGEPLETLSLGWLSASLARLSQVVN
jgi:hypothetical protein